MDFDKVVEERHSVREYKAAKVKFDDILEIIDSSRHAPCAGGIFSLKMIIVDKKEIKDALADASLGQYFISEAPYVIVVCSEIEQLRRAYGHKADVYARQQAGAAIENMLLKITELGLSTCWVGLFDENPIKRVLKIPANVMIEALLPVGHEMQKPKAKKTRVDLKNIVRFNGWENKKTKD